MEIHIRNIICRLVRNMGVKKERASETGFSPFFVNILKHCSFLSRRDDCVTYQINNNNNIVIICK